MELMTYKTRALRTLSLLILVALIAALNPPSLTDSAAYAQAAVPELTSSADQANQVDLSWTAVSGADDYELWRWETTEGWTQIGGSISDFTYTDTGVEAGKTYYYQVSADGGDTWSNRVHETVGALIAPTLDAPTATSSMISLTWSAVTGAASYELWRWETSWAQVGGVITVTSYADSSVEIGKTYYYQVRAISGSSQGAWSNRVDDTVPSTTPGAPQTLTATPSAAQVTLAWNEPTSNGGSAITSYEYRYQMAGGSWMNWMDNGMSRTATVSPLTNEMDYNFEVRAMNANGAGPAATASAMPMSTKPAIPTGLGTTSTGPTEIQLSWTAVAGAASYELQRRVNGGSWGDPMPVSGTSYTDTGLTPSTTYDYEVRAVNAAGTSEWSGVVTAATTDPMAPAAPTLTAAATDLTVMLTWTVPDNGGAPISGYKIEDSDDGSDWNDFAMPAANATSSDHMLEPGTMKYYRILAINSAGDGAWSDMKSATVAPAAPTLEATAGWRQITLSWNGADAVTSYHIERLDAQSQWVTVMNRPGSSTEYVHRSLNDATVYTYRIFAVNAAGESDASNSVSETTQAQPPSVPGQVSALTQVAGPGKVTLSWGSPALTGGVSISRYEYRYKETAANSFGSWMSVVLETMVEVMPLKPATEYTFEVRAVNSVGTGEAAETTSTPTATAPMAKPALMAVISQSAAVPPLDQTSLTFTALAASQNGGDPITEYAIQWKTGSESDWPDFDNSNTVIPAPAQSGLTSTYTALHTVTGGLSPGTTYQYRVRAINGIGGGPWSDTASVTTDVVAPDAPILHPAAGDTSTTPPQAEWDRNVNSITIKWTAPENDGGADVTSYEIWVGAAAVTDATEIAALDPNITNLPATRTEFLHPGLQSVTTYYYRVRARNGSGSGRVGDWSNEQSGATTATLPGTPEAPTGVSGSESAGNVTVTWTAPDAGTLPITHYEVQYQRDDDDDDDDWSDAKTGRPTPPTNAQFIHMNAEGASMYEYRVRAVNGNGAGEWSSVSSLVNVPARAPDAPMLSATAVGTDEILLEWTIPQNNGTEITGFSIQQWDPDPDNDPVTTAGAWGSDNLLDNAASDHQNAELTLYTVAGLTGGTKYYFRIQALLGGDWSATDMADAASDTTMAGVPAAPAPTVAAGTGDDAGSITVSWPAPNSGGSDITGYELRVWDGAKWVTEATPAADATSYKDDDLAPGTRYYYVLRAVNSIGSGPWSDDVSIETAAGAPDAPMLSAVATGRDSIRLTWTVPDDNGTPITGYELQRWDPDAGPAAWDSNNLLGVDDTVTEFVDTGLDPGTKYYYRIRAMPQTGDEGWSADDMDDAVSVNTHGDTPGRPTLVAPSGNGITANSLTVTWTAPGETGGSAITGYDVQVWDGAMWVDDASLGNVLTYTDRNLMAGTKYYYHVRAKNSQGPGLWSAYVSGTTTVAAPDAPVLMATTEGMNSIRLTWTVPDDNGTPITGYELQRWDPTASPAAAWGSANLLGGTDNNRVLFIDSGRDPGMMYHYRIRALPNSGAASWSMFKSATTDPAAPGRPMMVTAQADGKTAIDLSWNAPADNGSAIVRYELQMWDTDSSMWMNVRNDLPSSMTSYKHTGRTAGTRYVYRLRAVNRANDNSGLGQWSTIAFATTDE